MIRNRRKAFLVSAALLGGMVLMTACNQGSDAADSSSGKESTATATSNTSADKGVSDASSPSAGSGNTSGGGSTPGSGNTSGSSTSGSGSTTGGSTTGGSETVVEGLNKGKGVNGTWYGIVRYVAPGKYLVDGPAAKGSGGEQQIFYVAEDTVILGGGQICGVGGSKVDAPCEEADLEKAAKKGVEAQVELKNGIATQITDGALV
jgi:hypothetical protein